MLSILADKNVDFISPQLYSSGAEVENDYTENMGIYWTHYTATSAAFVPSLASGSLYSSAQTYFAGKNLSTKGYIQWQQSASTGTASPPTGSTVRCGTSWTAANSACGKTCVGDADCTAGTYCFASVDPSPCSSSSPSSPSSPSPVQPPTTQSSTTNKSIRCGVSWTDANGRCGTACPSSTNAECPSGQLCFNALDTSVCPAQANEAVAQEESQTASVSQTGNSQNSEIPGWGIALVVLGVLIAVLLGLVLFLVVRK